MTKPGLSIAVYLKCNYFIDLTPYCEIIIMVIFEDLFHGLTEGVLVNKKKKIGDYLLGRTLGEGAFAKVKSALHLPSGEKVLYLTYNLYLEHLVVKKTCFILLKHIQIRTSIHIL